MAERGPVSTLERGEFFNGLIGHLSGTLEEVLGRDDASAFIAAVGARMGEEIGDLYGATGGGLPPEEIARVLVDLKARIGGGFSVERITPTEIVLVNSRCPFGEKVRGRASLCMMTTNVFGRITADASGYARVEIEEAIALGDGGCRVRVHLTEDETGHGHEFYR